MFIHTSCSYTPLYDVTHVVFIHTHFNTYWLAGWAINRILIAISMSNDVSNDHKMNIIKFFDLYIFLEMFYRNLEAKFQSSQLQKKNPRDMLNKYNMVSNSKRIV